MFLWWIYLYYWYCLYNTYICTPFFFILSLLLYNKPSQIPFSTIQIITILFFFYPVCLPKILLLFNDNYHLLCLSSHSLFKEHSPTATFYPYPSKKYPSPFRICVASWVRRGNVLILRGGGGGRAIEPSKAWIWHLKLLHCGREKRRVRLTTLPFIINSSSGKLMFSWNPGSIYNPLNK